ncbi:hypothetical protein PLICRDRAFT_373771 [Plicaturopsis crispa FD-325 SS-3]|uniref:Uncharacterized protein n=1 Tax=Plicaturopsis crispa FD-325 SS-3 TaxID=944288 RepID=A0A0C9SKR4_PLICR|nr:hypothetical protein PLICRDRAFT_373771 [Plicaturopsis crispa FD-325 SS-3]
MYTMLPWITYSVSSSRAAMGAVQGIDACECVMDAPDAYTIDAPDAYTRPNSRIQSQLTRPKPTETPDGPRSTTARVRRFNAPWSLPALRTKAGHAEVWQAGRAFQQAGRACPHVRKASPVSSQAGAGVVRVRGW